MTSLMWFELRLRRGAILFGTIGLSFFSIFYIIVYTGLPVEVRGIDPQAVSFLKSLGVQTFATFEGFVLGTEFNVLPLIAAIFGMFLGIGTLVTEEDNGTLELMAALPVSRLSLILSKALALFLAILMALVVAGLVAMGVFSMLGIETPITAFDLLRVILSHWLMAFVFLNVSLFLGAFLPNRGAALSVAAAFLLVSFFGENLAGMAPVLEPYRPYFPFSYFKNVVKMLTGEIAWRDIGILFAMGLGFLILAMVCFQRRNLTVGAWPWQRPRIALGRSAD